MAIVPKNIENIENNEVNPAMESPKTNENFEDFSPEQLEFMDKVKQLDSIEAPEDSSLFVVALIHKGPSGNLKANIQGKGSDIIHSLQKLTNEQPDVKGMLEKALIANWVDSLNSLRNELFGDDEEQTSTDTERASEG